ncbi:inactive rhomboid protein 1-like [Amphibalanus amphitrite]|uniref:inactive rhomboid protein 1-like n=1 Tax=Amphibalanus amphitrite TaxID=1232801 RepID=UPI001C91531F|nr:inactive rhomboid protein 1-like [Amphibalanus amphitrite]
MSRLAGAPGVTGHVTCDVTEERAADADGYRRAFRESRGSAFNRSIIENPLFAMLGGENRDPLRSDADLWPVKRPLGEDEPPCPTKLSLGGGEQCSVRVTSREDRFIPYEGRPMKRCHSAPGGHVNLRDSAGRRPRLLHQPSRVDMVKSYMRQAAKHYFGLDESDDDRNRARWRERRRRLACRAYGRLKPECCQESVYEPPSYRRRSLSDLVDMVDGPEPATPAPCRRKEHVAQLTWRGLGYLSQWVAHGRLGGSSQRTRSRSFPRPSARPRSPPLYSAEEGALPLERRTDPLTDPAPPVADEVFFDKVPPNPGLPDDIRDPLREKAFGNRFLRTASEGDTVDAGPSVGHRRIWARLLDRLFDNSNRRQYGRGVAAKLFGGRKWRRSVASRADVASQLDDLEDHRPYFTYWVTTVQVLIMVISLGCYGFGPFGFELQQISGKVMDTSLSLQQVDYWEPANLWFGPRAADLIHLGAKFAPCMRRDARLDREIRAERSRERHTACCIRNDRSGCVQAPRTGCSQTARMRNPSTISTWHTWSSGRGSAPEGRISGPVCGQDPHYCAEPASRAPHEWPDDITQWPICKRPSPAPEGSLSAEHMTCEVVGHPCCVGIHGHCEIATREYCNFVNGFFHEEAALCSQVSCLDDVCGMIPFYDPEKPDQFYRLWTSLFLHAGIIHLVLTVVIQFFFLRDLEKMAGASRVAVIYIVSGMAGNLASSIFVPYRAEVGPAGSQFGLLACHFVEVINVWPMLQRPWRALCRLLGLTVVLFAVGLLPWVDNYAHIFGFIVGFLLSYALLPYVSFGPYDRARKKVLIAVCVTTVTLLVLFLLVLFYVTPFYDCEWCEYLNCLPLTRDFCAEQNINFDRRPRL